jgi:hypothetical protein
VSGSGDGATVGRRVLVVGSYPPVATPGAAATLAAVRRAMAAGDDPVVASPRPSAALYDVPVSGVFAGRRLERLRQLTGARHLVFVAERDLPFPTSTPVGSLLGAVQRVTLETLAKATRSFDTVTLVVADDLGVASSLLAGLRALTADVVDETEPCSGEPGITVLGPDGGTAGEQVITFGRKMTRRALGPLAPKLRRGAATALRRVRSRL